MLHLSVAPQTRLEGAAHSTPPTRHDPSYDPFGGMYVSRTLEAIVKREHQLGCRLDFRIRRAVDLCHSIPAHQLDVERIAAQVYLSPSRFRHLFTEQMGLSFHRYLKGLRLWTAHTLLGAGGFSLSEVRRLTGVDDPSHFARDYRRCYGVSLGFTRNRARLQRSMERQRWKIDSDGPSDAPAWRPPAHIETVAASSLPARPYTSFPHLPPSLQGGAR